MHKERGVGPDVSEKKNSTVFISAMLYRSIEKKKKKKGVKPLTWIKRRKESHVLYTTHTANNWTPQTMKMV